MDGYEALRKDMMAIENYVMLNMFVLDCGELNKSMIEHCKELYQSLIAHQVKDYFNTYMDGTLSNLRN